VPFTGRIAAGLVAWLGLTFAVLNLHYLPMNVGESFCGVWG
jgi:hypothetical protein